MQVYTRYKTARRRRPKRGGFYWLLALAGLAFVAWIIWKSHRPAHPPAPTTVRRVQPAPAPRPRTTNTPPARLARPTEVVPAPIPPGPQTNRAVPPPALMVTAAPPSVVAQGAPHPDSFPRPVQNALEAQIVLASLGFSAGSLDGVPGGQTRSALRAFQQREHLPLTGDLDSATRTRLVLINPPIAPYIFTADDLGRLLPVSTTWQGKSEQARLDFETPLELVAEKTRTHPNLIRRLNPGVDWNAISIGTVVQAPSVTPPTAHTKAAWVRIQLASKTLEAFDSATNLLVHFPCSIARQVEKRPVGELHVAVVAFNPNYTFNPEVFPESPEAQALDHKLILPPGPNNPVGLAWIGLDRAGYGIHGTPHPEEVGRTESHGCFRLANWNAELLALMVSAGTPVLVEP